MPEHLRTPGVEVTVASVVEIVERRSRSVARASGERRELVEIETIETVIEALREMRQISAARAWSAGCPLDDVAERAGVSRASLSPASMPHLRRLRSMQDRCTQTRTARRVTLGPVTFTLRPGGTP